MQRRERMLARGLLAVVLAVGAMSLWLAEFHREPYPGLIMPRFAHVGADAETTRSTTDDITEAFADGSTASLRPGQLVNTPVHAARFVRRNFSVGLGEDGELRNSSAPSHAEILLEGWDEGTPPRRGVARARDPRTVAWLRDRLATLHPERTPTHITFEWTRRTFQIPEGTLLDSEHRQTVEVQL